MSVTGVRNVGCFCTDPHIKVTGTKEAVTEAKEKILNILNTKVLQLCLTLTECVVMLFASLVACD